MGVGGWGRGLRRGGSVGIDSACNAGDTGNVSSINPWVGKIPGGENGNPVQYSCLENAMDRGVWRATVRGVAKSQTQLNTQSGKDWKICLWPQSKDISKKCQGQCYKDKGVGQKELP